MREVTHFMVNQIESFGSYSYPPLSLYSDSPAANDTGVHARGNGPLLAAGLAVRKLEPLAFRAGPAVARPALRLISGGAGATGGASFSAIAGGAVFIGALAVGATAALSIYEKYHGRDANPFAVWGNAVFRWLNPGDEMPAIEPPKKFAGDPPPPDETPEEEALRRQIQFLEIQKMYAQQNGDDDLIFSLNSRIERLASERAALARARLSNSGRMRAMASAAQNAALALEGAQEAESKSSFERAHYLYVGALSTALGTGDVAAAREANTGAGLMALATAVRYFNDTVVPEARDKNDEEFRARVHDLLWMLSHAMTFLTDPVLAGFSRLPVDQGAATVARARGTAVIESEIMLDRVWSAEDAQTARELFHEYLPLLRERFDLLTRTIIHNAIESVRAQPLSEFEASADEMVFANSSPEHLSAATPFVIGAGLVSNFGGTPDAEKLALAEDLEKAGDPESLARAYGLYDDVARHGESNMGVVTALRGIGRILNNIGRDAFGLADTAATRRQPDIVIQMLLETASEAFRRAGLRFEWAIEGALLLEGPEAERQPNPDKYIARYVEDAFSVHRAQLARMTVDGVLAGGLDLGGAVTNTQDLFSPGGKHEEQFLAGAYSKLLDALVQNRNPLPNLVDHVYAETIRRARALTDMQHAQTLTRGAQTKLRDFDTIRRPRKLIAEAREVARKGDAAGVIVTLLPIVNNRNNVADQVAVVEAAGMLGQALIRNGRRIVRIAIDKKTSGEKLESFVDGAAASFEEAADAHGVAEMELLSLLQRPDTGQQSSAERDMMAEAFVFHNSMKSVARNLHFDMERVKTALHEGRPVTELLGRIAADTDVSPAATILARVDAARQFQASGLNDLYMNHLVRARADLAAITDEQQKKEITQRAIQEYGVDLLNPSPL